jgi:hypothetical protein
MLLMLPQPTTATLTGSSAIDILLDSPCRWHGRFSIIKKYTKEFKY